MICGEFDGAHRVDVGIDPYAPQETHVFVGAYAHISPPKTYEFAEDFRKNGASCRGDVLNRPLRIIRGITIK